MPIQEQNIVFVESQILDDVPEGGGAATGREVVDGQMNNVFEDISDLDRAMGRFNLRKLFLAVRALNTDLYGGSKLVVTELPTDDALGYTIFTTRDAFDTRAEALNRVESYLFKGPMWHGALYSNHIVGMTTISVIQRVDSAIPPIGKTLCLVQDEGLGSEKEQYIRIIDVDVTETTFTQNGVDYQAWVVSMGLSDPLAHDFTGHEPNRDFYNYTGKVRLRDTTVADAQRYFGARPLAHAASIGDRTVRADSMFNALVPAARTETSIVNQPLAPGLIPMIKSGEPYSYTATISIAPNEKVFTRGGVLPGSLTITRSSYTITDDGEGNLLWGSAIAGVIDYAGGELTFGGGSVGSYGYSTIAYTPAAGAPQQAHTMAVTITPENRALNWVRLLQPTPAPGTLSVSFLAQGNWNVLADAAGDGTLKGSDPAIGAGTINYVNSTASVSLGALPDVGSQIIYTWGSPVHYAQMDESVTTSEILNDEVKGEQGNAKAKFYLYGKVNTASVVITIPMPSGDPLVLTYQDNNPAGDPGLFEGSTRYGSVDNNRVVLLFPGPNYPADNTEISITYDRTVVRDTATQEMVEEPVLKSLSLPPGQDPSTPDYIFNVNEEIDPGTLRIRPQWNFTHGRVGSAPGTFLFALVDDGQGNVGLEWDTPSVFSNVVRFHGAVNSADGGFKVIGAVNYTTGLVTIFRNIAVRVYIYSSKTNQWNVVTPQAMMNPVSLTPIIYARTEEVLKTTTGSETSTEEVTIQRTIFPAAEVEEPDPEGFGPTIINKAVDLVLSPPGFSIVPGSLVLQAFGMTYVDRSGVLYADPSPTTGAGTPAGTIDYTQGTANITHRAASGGSTRHALLIRRGEFAVSDVHFRVAQRPLAPEGFTLSATTQRTDVLISGLPDQDGLLSADAMQGSVSYEFGTGYARFGAYASPDPEIINIGSPSHLQTFDLSQTGGYKVHLLDNSGTYWDSHIQWDRDVGTVKFVERQGVFAGPNPTDTPLSLHFYPHDPDLFDSTDTQGDLQWLRSEVLPETIRYSAVAFAYIPLDASILGINAVRLPTDGRVPIYKPGDVAMVMHRQETAPVTPTVDVPVSLGRTRVAWVRVIDANGDTVTDGYTLDRENGTVTFNPVPTHTPVTIRHTVGDLRLITDVQITGDITLARPVSHDFPAGETLIASCLLFGDRRARVSHLWDQVSWNGTWQDSIEGSEATATLNTIDFPITVTNEGCDTDRWVLRVTNAASNLWELISEKRGLVWSGTYAPGGNDIVPINPRTRVWDDVGQAWVGGTPYLTIPGLANGGGWSTGNVVRINTVGAIADFWIARSIAQSDVPAGDGLDGAEIYALGNIDRPEP